MAIDRLRSVVTRRPGWFVGFWVILAAFVGRSHGRAGDQVVSQFERGGHCSLSKRTRPASAAGAAAPPGTAPAAERLGALYGARAPPTRADTNLSLRSVYHAWMSTEGLSHHISSRYNTDLERVRSSVLEMGGLVERQLTQAIGRRPQASNMSFTVARIRLPWVA